MTASLPRSEDQRTGREPAPHQCFSWSLVTRSPASIPSTAAIVSCASAPCRTRAGDQRRCRISGPPRPTAPPGRLCAMVERPPLTQWFRRRGQQSKAGSLSQQHPNPTSLFRFVRFGGKRIFVSGNVCHSRAGASRRQKLKTGSVLVYPTTPNVERDAESMSELAGSGG
jgi:hypothetical protein